MNDGESPATQSFTAGYTAPLAKISVLVSGFSKDGYTLRAEILSSGGGVRTRQQAASILGRYLVAAELAKSGHIQGAQGTYESLAAWFAAEGQAVLAPFTDAARLATVHAPYAAYLIYHQVIMGSNSMLNPLASLTRAQAAALVYRAAN